MRDVKKMTDIEFDRFAKMFNFVDTFMETLKNNPYDLPSVKTDATNFIKCAFYENADNSANDAEILMAIMRKVMDEACVTNADRCVDELKNADQLSDIIYTGSDDVNEDETPTPEAVTVDFN